MLFQLSSLPAPLNKLVPKKVTPNQPLVSVSVPNLEDAKSNLNLLLLMPTGDGFIMLVATKTATMVIHGVANIALIQMSVPKTALLMVFQLLIGTESMESNTLEMISLSALSTNNQEILDPELT